MPIIQSSFLQAFLSALLSSTLGFFVARSLFYKPIKWVDIIFKKISLLYFVMPSLMIILLIIGIYGNNGMINRFFALFDSTLLHNIIYGYHGVLLAHVMINMPLAFWVFTQIYSNIPTEYWHIARYLHLSTWQRWYLIEYPAIKPSFLGVFTLIFLYCFMSFAIILVLGGGAIKTFELSIFQAFYREFNPPKAAMLALLQIICVLPIIILLAKEHVSVLSVKKPTTHYNAPYKQHIITRCIIWGLAIFYILPFIWVADYFINRLAINTLFDSNFYIALLTSVMIAVGAVALNFIIAYSALMQSSTFLHHAIMQKIYHIIPVLFLALPPFILLSGYYAITGSFAPVIIPLITIQALLLYPLTWRFMHYNIAHNLYQRQVMMRVCHLSFCQKHLLLWREYKDIILRIIAIGLALSLGDFSIIAMLGHEGIETLPLYLYRHISHYQFNDAIFVGIMLLCIQMCIFMSLVRK